MSAKVRASHAGASLIVRGVGFWLVPPVLPLGTPVRVQLHRVGAPAQCWDASYSGFVVQNDARMFRAGSDAP